MGAVLEHPFFHPEAQGSVRESQMLESMSMKLDQSCNNQDRMLHNQEHLKLGQRNLEIGQQELSAQMSRLSEVIDSHFGAVMQMLADSGLCGVVTVP